MAHHAPVCSFDVFDTALTRLVGEPAGLFHLLGRRLEQAGEWRSSVGPFAAARIEAERVARVNATREEVTLDDIYTQLAWSTGADEETASGWKRAELHLEDSLIRCVPETRARVESERKQGRRITFVSDTYFPIELVTRWLHRFGLHQDGDRVFASSDAGLTKATGHLYETVLKEQGVSATDLLHLGDNCHSDVRMPRSLGIRAERFGSTDLTDRERLLEKHRSDTFGLTSLFAGSARSVRLDVDQRVNRGGAALRDLAVAVAAPVLCAYVLWLLRKAQELRLRRLYFVARDGEILIRIARVLVSKTGMDLQLVYLHANRQIVNLASIDDLRAGIPPWVFESCIGCAPEDVLRRVGLTADDVREQAASRALSLTSPIDASGETALRDVLAHEDVRQKILRAAAVRRQHARDYFASVGLMDGDACALVDVGWKGRAFSSLRRILGPQHQQHVALYFGLYERPRDVSPSLQHAFLFDGGLTPPRGEGSFVEGLPNAIEIFCQATHGQVLGMGSARDGFPPILERAINDVGPSWKIDCFQDCVEAFVQNLEVDSTWVSAMPDLRPMCIDALRSLLSAPSKVEAELLGSFRYVDGQTGSGHSLSEPYRRSDLVSVFLTGDRQRPSPVSWTSGDITLTPRRMRFAVKAARKLGRAALKLRSMRARHV